MYAFKALVRHRLCACGKWDGSSLLTHSQLCALLFQGCNVTGADFHATCPGDLYEIEKDLKSAQDLVAKKLPDLKKKADR